MECPTIRQITEKLDWFRNPSRSEYDLAIYGAGPAGLSTTAGHHGRPRGLVGTHPLHSPANPTGIVLPTDREQMHLVAVDRANRLQHIDLLVANLVGLERNRRLHGDQTEQLQQVVLHHVTQR